MACCITMCITDISITDAEGCYMIHVISHGSCTYILCGLKLYKTLVKQSRATRAKDTSSYAITDKQKKYLLFYKYAGSQGSICTLVHPCQVTENEYWTWLRHLTKFHPFQQRDGNIDWLLWVALTCVQTHH